MRKYVMISTEGFYSYDWFQVLAQDVPEEKEENHKKTCQEGQ
jgi:hypothetical protein